MKLHHFLTILCVIFLIAFVTMTVIYFDLGNDILALEKEIETITAERDQLAEEIELLNTDLEDHKTDINNLVISFNKLHDEAIYLNDFVKEISDTYKEDGSSAISSIMTKVHLRASYSHHFFTKLPPLLTK